MTGSLIPLGSINNSNEASFMNSLMFRSGTGIWAFHCQGTGKLTVQNYTQSPYSYGAWITLKKNNNGTAQYNHLWHDLGSIILASRSGGNTIGIPVSGIQFALAAIPSSGLAVVGQLQFMPTGSVAMAGVAPTVMNATDNVIWYASDMLYNTGAPGTRRWDIKIGRSSAFNVTGTAFTNADVLGTAPGSQEGTAWSYKPLILPLPGGSAMVLMHGNKSSTAVDKSILRSVVIDSGLNIGSAQIITSGIANSVDNGFTQVYHALADENNNVHLTYIGSNNPTGSYGWFYRVFTTSWSSEVQIAAFPGSMGYPCLAYDSGGQILRMFGTKVYNNGGSGAIFTYVAGSPWTTWALEGSQSSPDYYSSTALSNAGYWSANISMNRYASGTFSLMTCQFLAGSEAIYFEYRSGGFPSTANYFYMPVYSIP